MENKTIWELSIKKSNFLNQEIHTKYLIIGSGITGVSIAYFLSQKEQDITVIEQNELGSGITKNTTGKITYLQGDLLLKIIKTNNISTAKQYLASQINGMNLLTSIIKKENISCDFTKASSHVLWQDNTNHDDYYLLKDFLTQENIPLSSIALPLHIPYLKKLSVDDTYLFHPIKYLVQLKEITSKQGVTYYDDTRAKKIIKQKQEYVVTTNCYDIHTQTIIFACHYPFFFQPLMFPFKTSLEKSYLCAFPLTTKPFSAINIDKNVHSYRTHQNHILYLAKSEKLGFTYQDNEKFENLKTYVQNTYHQKIDFKWTNFDIMTSDFLPLIGKLNKDENLYLATGYNTWGMINATLAGKIITELIINKTHPYQHLFSPTRKSNFKNLIASNTHQSIMFMKSYFKKDYAYITTIHHKKYGIYVDECKKRHIVKLICPHLKCYLHFNAYQKTWDCPCHGSRFSIDGKVIKGPATNDITKEID